MKKNLFFSLAAGVALTASLASCSDDAGNQPNVITPDKTTAYAKVSLTFPKVSGTRATGDYAEGIETEQAIKKVTLGFYDQYNNYIGKGDLYSNITNDGLGSTGSGNVSNKHDLVFKLDLMEGANEPKWVVAFINTEAPSVTLSELNNGYPIQVNKDIVADASTGFPMTNSGYYAEDNKTTDWTMAAEFKGEFYDTAELAAAATTPNTQIYVERLAAKIQVKNATLVNQDDVNYVVEDVAGQTITLEFTATNWSATGTATEEHLVKQKFEAPSFGDYNKASDFRSYWANSVNYEKPFTAYYKDGKTTGILDYVTFGDIWNTEENPNDFDLDKLTAVGGDTYEYVPEHVSGLGIEQENLIASTYALVVGTYTLSGTNSSWFENSSDGYDFYLLLTGMDEDGKKTYTAYNEDQLAGLLLHYNGYDEVFTNPEGGEVGSGIATETNNNDTKFTEYFTVEYDGTTKKYYLVAGNNKLYTASGDEVTIDAAAANQNTTNSKHYHYANGAAYFNAPIAHHVTDNEGFLSEYGVVRNHSYILTINAITTLGAPLDDNGLDEENQDTPIIPDPDELKDHYIKAEINVLSWHTVENGVIL